MDNSSDIEVLHRAIEWLDRAATVTLVTVADTWGSSPRQPGSLMAIHPEGEFVGSVSGGCVEDDLIQRVMKGEFDTTLPRIIDYGVGATAMQRIGLPCGGRLSLLVESLDNAVQLRKVLEHIEAGHLVQRHVCLATGETHLQPHPRERDFYFTPNKLVKVFGPRQRLLIVGAGELARRVAQLALTLDYAVTLCDPRPEYAHNWQVEGTQFVSTAPGQTIAHYQADKRTAILVLSHTPAIDDEALFAALQTQAFYVGALGSTKNQNARRKRLLQQGLSPAQLGRLHGPVGLDIGSHTPAEIAVSIVAALIAEKNAQAQAKPQALAQHHSAQELISVHG